MSEQQLLKIRLNALKKDVEKVENVAIGARRRTEMIRNIDSCLRSSINPLKTIRNIANRVLGDLDTSPELSTDFACNGETETLEVLIRQIHDQVDQVRSSHMKVMEDVTQMVSEAPSLTDDIQTQLARHIGRGCGDLRRKIENIQESLQADSTGSGGYRELWREFDAMLESDARQLFTDYVDFVGGMAVRDSALDDQVCTMTDRLLAELSLRGLLAVPAQQAALGQVIQSVVKLGFPEWTIWGIPLVGHEVGLRVPLHEPELRELMVGDAQYGMRAALRKSLFADLFAAYVLGPCYADAVIQFRLEPHHTHPRSDDEPCDGDRAELILRVLDRLAVPDRHGSSKGKLDERYRGTVKNLREAWQREVGESAAQGADSVRQEESGQLDDFLDEALKRLAESQFRAFGPEQWKEALNLSDYLRQPDKPQNPPLILDLLTGAWDARIAVSAEMASQMSGAEPEQVTKIETELARRIEAIERNVTELGKQPLSAGRPGPVLPGPAGSRIAVKEEVSKP